MILQQNEQLYSYLEVHLFIFLYGIAQHDNSIASADPSI